MKINILGTKYNIILNAEVEDYPALEKVDGYCDSSIKQIIIAKFTPDRTSIADLEMYSRKVLRHEITHAFLYESGLSENSDWARNEELVDWIAMQFEKMLDAFKKIGAVQ